MNKKLSKIICYVVITESEVQSRSSVKLLCNNALCKKHYRKMIFNNRASH